MHVDRRLDTDRLADLIDKKHDILVQLRELSRCQATTIAAGDMNHLLGVLASKQQLLNELQATERELDPFRTQDPDGRNWRSAEDRNRCRQTAQRCESLLSEIMLVEKQCEADLTVRRDQTAARLDGAHHATQARHAYATGPARRGAQLDVSSQS